MRVDYSKAFKKQYKKLPKNVQDKFIERLKLFLNDATASQLNLHRLSGKYNGLYSINITGNVRAILDRDITNLIYFMAIGSHSELYG